MFDQDQRDVVKGTVVPIPSKQTAGVYIFQSVYGHTVVGPTNVRQASKTDRAVGPIFSHTIFISLGRSTDLFLTKST